MSEISFVLLREDSSYSVILKSYLLNNLKKVYDYKAFTSFFIEPLFRCRKSLLIFSSNDQIWDAQFCDSVLNFAKSFIAQIYTNLPYMFFQQYFTLYSK